MTKCLKFTKDTSFICDCGRVIRHFGSRHVILSKDSKLKIESAGPKNISLDWVGPADSISNIRKYKFAKPANESAAHRQLRELREDTYRFNDQFWAKHNKNFLKSKEKYIEETLQKLQKQNPSNPPEKLTSKQLSVFYKEFLDTNYRLHKQYNKEWYRLNMKIVWLSLKEKFTGAKKSST